MSWTIKPTMLSWKDILILFRPDLFYGSYAPVVSRFMGLGAGWCRCGRAGW
jgi:hypothetical protein